MFGVAVGPVRAGERENFSLPSPLRGGAGGGVPDSLAHRSPPAFLSPKKQPLPPAPPRSGEGEGFLFVSLSGERENFSLPSPLRGGAGGGVPDSLAHRPLPTSAKTEYSVGPGAFRIGMGSLTSPQMCRPQTRPRSLVLVGLPQACIPDPHCAMLAGAGESLAVRVEGHRPLRFAQGR